MKPTFYQIAEAKKILASADYLCSTNLKLIIMKELDCIFLVYGKSVNSDFSNVNSISTKVIPNIGDMIRVFGENLIVTDRCIDYKHVEKYDLNDPDRGGECVYLFVEPIF